MKDGQIVNQGSFRRDFLRKIWEELSRSLTNEITLNLWVLKEVW